MEKAALFFETQHKFRSWLEKNHERESELLVGFYKVNSGKLSMTWSESVDQALCFGWIDGVRKSIDEESYSIRFTPRKKTSIWSSVNIKKMEVLRNSGLMTPAGETAFAFRTEKRSNIYSHESEAKQLDADLEKAFKTNKPAWEFFEKQPPSYKKVIVHWIMTAKQEKTRQSRLDKVIVESGLNKRVR